MYTASAPYEYRLVAQKQPGTGAVPLAVQIALPEGMALLGYQGAGRVVAEGTTVRVETDLLEDREIKVWYRRASVP